LKREGNIPLKDIAKSHYVFTDDMRFCPYCFRKFVTNAELLFHLEGCKERQYKLYPQRKKQPTEQEELGRWLNL
jgi:hypothetical protein